MTYEFCILDFFVFLRAKATTAFSAS